MPGYENEEEMGMMGVLGDVEGFMDDRLPDRTPEAPNQNDADFLKNEAKQRNLPHQGNTEGGIEFSEDDMQIYEGQELEMEMEASPELEDADFGNDVQAGSALGGPALGGNPLGPLDVAASRELQDQLPPQPPMGQDPLVQPMRKRPGQGLY